MVDRLLGKKVIGVKQANKSIKNGLGKVLYVAKDADHKLTTSLVDSAEDHSVEVIYVETMKELGKLCGIEVGASAALILKD
ncbi:ribosomal L7Ae/L30e/S12e/Gadd45 family protein [Desnuesiella massiliensis]|uniref:ribosomal L7Ae/L30e/S12e/Gadd45 family protein n=1 Tax=Desnuesiella massiliensis TaxID=1650662 RepID=UPI0006E17BF4|nr:ribosomal L7Ae/L30e/S12e/Gadd45 family protein [Desnuesiella massiliensis]